MTQRLVFAGVSDDKTSDFIVDEAVTDTPMSIKKGCTPEEIMACGKRVWPGREWRISPDALILASPARSMDVVVCGAAGDARVYDPTTGADAWDALMWVRKQCVTAPMIIAQAPVGEYGAALVRLVANWPAGR